MNEMLQWVAGLSVAVAVLALWVVALLAGRKGLVLNARQQGREELERELSRAINNSKHITLHGICYRVMRHGGYDEVRAREKD